MQPAIGHAKTAEAAKDETLQGCTHVNKPANDNQPRKTTAAIPLAIRLFRQKRSDDLARLVRYGTVVTVPSWLSAEGGLPEAGKPRPDRVVETRPSPTEQLAVIAREAANTRTQVGPFTRAEFDAAAARCVRYDMRGLVSEWLCSDGKWRPATELVRQPRGRRRKSEQERQGDNARHLAIRGSAGFPEPFQHVSTTPSEGEDFCRLRAAHWVQAMGACNDNARIIDRLRVGSRNPFAEARGAVGLLPSERGPTVIATGAEFLAFRVHSNSRAMQGGVEGGHDLIERQIVETIDQPRIDAALGEHGKVLDLSIAGKTAREIAVELGWGDTKQAERQAVAAQDAALHALAGLEEKMAA